MTKDEVIANRRANLAALADRIGSKTELAKRTGKKIQHLSGMLSGGKTFGDRVARDIETALDLPDMCLDFPGTGETVEIKGGTVEAGDEEAGDPGLIKINALEVRQEYALANVPRVSKVRLIEIDRDWLYEQSIPTSNPRAIKLMSAPSDSMEPAIPQGASIGVDLSQRTFSANGIYAMSYSGSIFIHRVQVLPGNRYVLLSDNPNYGSINLDSLEGIYIIGRCIVVNSTHSI